MRSLDANAERNSMRAAANGETGKGSVMELAPPGVSCRVGSCLTSFLGGRLEPRLEELPERHLAVSVHGQFKSFACRCPRFWRLGWRAVAIKVAAVAEGRPLAVEPDEHLDLVDRQGRIDQVFEFDVRHGWVDALWPLRNRLDPLDVSIR